MTVDNQHETVPQPHTPITPEQLAIATEIESLFANTIKQIANYTNDPVEASRVLGRIIRGSVQFTQASLEASANQQISSTEEK